MSTKYYTVSELTSKTRSILELSLDGVWVEGEISNLHYHSSGHIYLTLKDKISELRCVFFKHINILSNLSPKFDLMFEPIFK